MPTVRFQKGLLRELNQPLLKHALIPHSGWPAKPETPSLQLPRNGCNYEIDARNCNCSWMELEDLLRREKARVIGRHDEMIGQKQQMVR